MSAQTPSSNVVKYDPRFEGIQKDIDVFGDMTLKQIDFVAKILAHVPVVRGCFNVCSHCARYAKPPISQSETHINRMDFEDFKALCDGFLELNRRLGYNICATNRRYPNYKALHFDSDDSNVYLTDKNGVLHDFIELASMLQNATGIPPMFDTAGWNIKDRATQERMEKYAKHYACEANSKNVSGFYYSVNPFHSIYTASVKAGRKGDVQKAREYRDIFTDRAANILFTLTPTILAKNLVFIPRAVDPKHKGVEGFTTNDCFLLYIDVFKKLEERYRKDLSSGAFEHISSDEQIKEIMDTLYLKLLHFQTISSPVGRMLDIFQNGDPVFKTYYQNKKNILKHLNSIMDPATNIFSVIDLNGKVYIGTQADVIPTELAFNFKNKYKKTAPMGTGATDYVLTNDLLERII